MKRNLNTEESYKDSSFIFHAKFTSPVMKG
nr:MAG TPA: hypothetical protein [Caudoviricetes sp.]